MRVLIVESRSDLGCLWRRHLDRLGMTVMNVQGQSEAIRYLNDNAVDIIILDVVLLEGSALAICDYASFRQPDAKVIFVTSSSFFSDGSIFEHASNASAFLPTGTPPEDLAAMVEYYGSERR